MDGVIELRVEIDYADDQVRVTDRVEDMRSLVDYLVRAQAFEGMEWNLRKIQVLALRYLDPILGVSQFDPLIPNGRDGMIQALDLENDDTHKVLGVSQDARAMHRPPTGGAEVDDEDSGVPIPNPRQNPCTQDGNIQTA